MTQPSGPASASGKSRPWLGGTARTRQLGTTGDNLRRDALFGVARVAWIVRLVETGAGGDHRSMDVMEIARPGDLRDIAIWA